MPTMIPSTLPFDFSKLRDAPDNPVYGEKLPSPEYLRMAAEVIKKARVPIGQERARTMIEQLLDCYPQHRAGLPLHYVAALTEELAAFPSRIAKDAVIECRRSCKFPPTCADLFQAADRLMSARSRAIRKAERLAELAERQAAEEAERASLKASREITPELEAKLAELRSGKFKSMPKSGGDELGARVDESWAAVREVHLRTLRKVS